MQQQLELLAQQLELPNFEIKIGQMLAGQLLNFRTWSLTSARQLQKLSYFLERDPKSLSSAHEVEQTYGVFIVNPVAVRKACSRPQ
jgi:hypothetical protein